MADTSSTSSFDLQKWFKENTMIAVAGIGAVLLFIFMGKKKGANMKKTVRLSKSTLRAVRGAAASGVRRVRMR